MKKILLALMTFAIMLYVGCPAAVLLDAPEITNFYMDSSSVTVAWLRDSLIECHEDALGYNIYVYTDSIPLLVDDGENLNKYNPEVIPFPIHLLTAVSYTIDGLSQDSIYYIQVRTVNIDNEVGSYNTNVPFVKASPRPEFISTVNFATSYGDINDSCAIRFSDAAIMADSAMPNNDADMWVNYYPFVIGDTVKFISPHQHAQYGANSRNTDFVSLGQYRFDEISEVTTEPTEYSVGVIEDDLLIARTEDGNYVKIHVDVVDTVNYTVTITYAYQNIAGFPHF